MKNCLHATHVTSLPSHPDSYVLGHDAMRRMGATNVLISGMKGLGVEIAKNVVLAGVKSVTIHDPQPVKIEHLSSQVSSNSLRAVRPSHTEGYSSL